ncbi:MAG: deoxyribodipyrimidine photo-lyase [Thermodesulfobacteriota bacterium]
MNERRARLLKDGVPGKGPVVYWMHRDHRARDNWALLYAATLARRREAGFVAAHCLDPSYPAARPGHFRFLLEGLGQVREDLRALGVPFIQLLGSPPAEVAALASRLDAAAVAADFDPLRHKRRWLAEAGRALACPLYEVDARNVVPCFAASDKPEYMARTIRPKIHRQLTEFLEEFPEPPRQRCPVPDIASGRTPEEVEQAMPGLSDAAPSRFFEPGGRAAERALADFIENRLPGYSSRRNDPSLDGQSGLSPWLHFGMLSAQRAALAAAASHAPAGDKEAFLEELIVRRELSDNFCLHRQDYDSPTCYPDWARRTLDKHAADPRPYVYTRRELEAGETHDPAWNAAQREMVLTGKMHGYMRMYWGKKLLEWTSCAEEAHEIAVALNDAHELDGRDPNGYAGIAWCLGGVHDRPWKERPVFGQIRYMNFAGLRRKFDVDAYVAKVAALG